MSKREKFKPPSAPTSAPSEKQSAGRSSRSKKSSAALIGDSEKDELKRTAKPSARGLAAESNAEKSPPRKLRRHRRRVRLGEAMRKYGLDEHTIAETYAGVLQTLRNRNEGEGIEKLLVDVLKECTRVLEPPAKAADRSGGETLVQVQLVHNVPRPERKPQAQLRPSPADVMRNADRLRDAPVSDAPEASAPLAEFSQE